MNLSELGGFLKSRRDRIRPADVGLPTGRGRRVSGLRREEVAQLAGASVDYYIELERGAGVQPSEQMLAALARALRLSREERDHLFALAGRPVPRPGGPADHVHPGMLDLMHRLDGTPAQVVTDLRVMLVQNPLARALLGPPPSTTGWTASFLYRWFTDPAARTLYPPEDHAKVTRSFVADLRAASARRGNDPEVTAIITALTARSPEFREHWARHDVEFRRHDRKRLIHPELGLLEVNCLSLFSEDGRQRLLWFTPAVGTDSVAKLELLAVLGTDEVQSDRSTADIEGLDA
ncbi:helix-turn-helix transcriptional regulator [Streptomyces sp. NBC_00457]|uniref:helix-turn-helix transcriptional regulator n=1 Tax=Streptomyces sp. NBC_00457 TaxID=2975748 RepID=UPI002E1D53B4